MSSQSLQQPTGSPLRPGLYDACIREFFSIYVRHATEEGLDIHPAVTQAVSRALAMYQEEQHQLQQQQQQKSSAQTALKGIELHFENASLCSDDVLALTPAIGSLPLRSLSLRGCLLGDSGLYSMCRSLSTSSGASTARQQQEQLHNAAACSSSTTAPFYSLSLPLSSCYGRYCTLTLQRLDLSDTALTDAAPLASLLQACPHLKHLDLSWNRLGLRPEGISVLCSALRLHDGLESVNVSSNLLDGARGGLTLAALSEWIVAAGRDSACLTRVDLRDNHLGVFFNMSHHLGSAQSNLLDAVRVWRRDRASLAEPEPPLHRFSEKYLEDLAYSAQVTANTSWQALCGSGHPLVEALYLNNTLCELQLGGNGLPDTFVQWIEAKVRVNARTMMTRCRKGGEEGADRTEAATPPLHAAVEAVKARYLGSQQHQEPKKWSQTEVMELLDRFCGDLHATIDSAACGASSFPPSSCAQSV